MCNFLKSLVAFMTGIYLSYLVLLFVLNPEFVLKGKFKAVASCKPAPVLHVLLLY